MKTYHRALTIAGSDSGGGAGIQADLKTFSALGCFGMSVITALTAQNTQTVTAIHPAPPEFIAAQMDSVLTDMGTDAVKIGMLHSPKVIEVVADRLTAHRVANIVLDPVMVAKSGDKLLRDDAIEALKERLIPLADVITPNLPEASALLERSVTTADHMAEACRDLARLGCRAVLLKGGHLEDADSSDCLYVSETDALVPLSASRIQTVNAHGTGCTLSSAVAAHLARGFSLSEAVGKAKTYITQALKAGAQFKIGHGHGPVHHFHAFWQ